MPRQRRAPRVTRRPRPAAHRPAPVKPLPKPLTPHLPLVPLIPLHPPPVHVPPGNQAPITNNQQPQPSPPPPLDLARIIDEACEFILARKQAHAKQIAWEVGEFLFERVYRGDLGYIETHDPTKPDSLRDIAARTGLGHLRLQSWIRAYVARKYLAPAGIDVDLSMSNFEALRPLILHPDAARAILDLCNRRHLTTQQLDALAVAWKKRLDEGGRLEDLLAASLPPSATPHSHSHSHSPRPLPDHDLTVIRLLGVVLRWLQHLTLSPTLRTSLSRDLTRLRAAVASPSLPLPSPGPITVNPQAALPTAPPDQQLVPDGLPTTNNQQLVDSAVLFIRNCLRRHGLRFALEVGDYLFRHVYGGDRALFRKGGHRWQVDTIQRIARDPRVGFDDDFLYKSIHAFLLVGQVNDALPPAAVPELPLTTWNELWPLDDNPAALVPVAQWAAAQRVPAATVAAIAALVAPYLAHGGSLDDLLAGSQRTPPDTPYRRIRRLLTIIGSLLARAPLSPRSRPRALAALAACLAAVG
ncbi:MAG: hypothetical protein HY905_13290 [Deltaproteobacteria bacterium]|nr:hypothetical protein [Deltaproteobacteria bacterium]